MTKCASSTNPPRIKLHQNRYRFKRERTVSPCPSATFRISGRAGAEDSKTSFSVLTTAWGISDRGEVPEPFLKVHESESCSKPQASASEGTGRPQHGRAPLGSGSHGDRPICLSRP